VYCCCVILLRRAWWGMNPSCSSCGAALAEGEIFCSTCHKPTRVVSPPPVSSAPVSRETRLKFTRRAPLTWLWPYFYDYTTAHDIVERGATAAVATVCLCAFSLLSSVLRLADSRHWLSFSQYEDINALVIGSVFVFVCWRLVRNSRIAGLVGLLIYSTSVIYDLRGREGLRLVVHLLFALVFFHAVRGTFYIHRWYPEGVRKIPYAKP
jgi:hypothetical protein